MLFSWQEPWECCRPPRCFFTSLSSLCFCTAPQSSSWLLCSLFCTLVLLQSLCTSVVSAAVFGCTDPGPHLCDPSLNTPPLLPKDLFSYWEQQIFYAIHKSVCITVKDAESWNLPTYLSLECFHYFQFLKFHQIKLDARALCEAFHFQLQLNGCKHQVMIAAKKQLNNKYSGHTWTHMDTNTHTCMYI